MTVKVKICGLTNAEDAAVAVEAGADAVGFVFHKKSPRCAETEVVKAIVKELPPFVLPIGVFVNEEAKVVRDIMDSCGLALAQLHGDETAAYCESLGRPVLKAIRLRDRRSFLALAEFQGRAGVRGFLVDAFSPDAYGGTGVAADLLCRPAAFDQAPLRVEQFARFHPRLHVASLGREMLRS